MDIPTIFSFVVTAGGCTWALARALGKLESALSTHAAEDKATHENLTGRVLKLEKRRR